MLYKETANGFEPWNPAEPLDGIRYQPNIGDLWSSEELAQIGLFEPEPAEKRPEGKIVVGETVERVNGVVKVVQQLADAPLPEPADIELTMRQLRLGLKNIGGFPMNFIPNVINTAIPEGTHRDDAIIWYEETITVEWSHPMTQALMLVSGISEDDAKAMWIAASKIPA